MTTAADYTGRTIDVLAWNADVADGSMVGPGSTGKIVTGIYKLAQRFYIALLTEVNTVRYDYEGRGLPFGCGFMTAVRRGEIHSDAEVFSEFALAELDIRRQIRSLETDTDPDDEKYGSVTLSQVTINKDTAELTVQLASKASNVQLILPISTIS